LYRYAEAKKAVKVNYFLNSPDAETQDMERMTIAARAADNSMLLRSEMHWERGHKPSRHKIVVPGAAGAVGVGADHTHVFVGGVATPAGKSYGGEVEPAAAAALGEEASAAEGAAEEGAAAAAEEGAAADVEGEAPAAEAALAQLSADAAEEAAAGEAAAAAGEAEEAVAE
jgi:hypothetical protein